MANETPTPAKPIKDGPGSAGPTASASASPPTQTSFEPVSELSDAGVEFESAASTAPDDGKIFSPQALKDGASRLGREAADKARGYVEGGKTRAGGALDDLAKMMTDAAATVDEKVGPQYGQYARSAAEAISGFSESFKAKDLDDLIADATGFVKKSPAIAIGTAAALGFVLVRLIKSGLDTPDDKTDV